MGVVGSTSIPVRITAYKRGLMYQTRSKISLLVVWSTFERGGIIFQASVSGIFAWLFLETNSQHVTSRNEFNSSYRLTRVFVVRGYDVQYSVIMQSRVKTLIGPRI